MDTIVIFLLIVFGFGGHTGRSGYAGSRGRPRAIPYIVAAIFLIAIILRPLGVRVSRETRKRPGSGGRGAQPRRRRRCHGGSSTMARRPVPSEAPGCVGRSQHGRAACTCPTPGASRATHRGEPFGATAGTVTAGQSAAPSSGASPALFMAATTPSGAITALAGLASTSAVFVILVGLGGRSVSRTDAYQEGLNPPVFLRRGAGHGAQESRRTALAGFGGPRQGWRKARLRQRAYVMGSEPGSADTRGRASNRERGTLPILQPGERREYTLKVDAADRYGLASDPSVVVYRARLPAGVHSVS